MEESEFIELKQEVAKIKANQILIVETLRRREKEGRRIVREALQRALDETWSPLR